MSHFRIGFESTLFEITLYYIVPYGALTLLGFNYYDFYDKTKKYIICISLLLFVILGSYYWAKSGSFQSVQAFKYPPQMYYLGHGIGCSFLLMHIFSKHDLKI